MVRKTGIVMVCTLMTAVLSAGAQPKQNEHGGALPPPMIAPFGHGGQMRDMENAPPMMLDIGELRSLLSEISIDSVTADKVVVLTREFIKKFEGVIIKVQRQELAIKEELLKDKPDLKIVQKSISEKAQYFSEIEFMQIKRDLDIKALLTPDQYDRLKSATIKKMRSMMPSTMQHDGKPDEERRGMREKGPEHAK